MKFALKDVKPNPFRDLKRFPIQPAKVEALIESIGTTEFWENIEGRVVDGKLEIAYGHHRVDALRKIYKPSDEFNFIVRKLSDADMIQRMARENNEAYGNDLGAVIESVRATVEAYGEGKLELPKLSDKTNAAHVRYAPSFVAGVSSPKLGEHPYTALSLSLFLGYTKKDGKEPENKVTAALGALELEELKIAGFDAKALRTYRTPDGVIPVDRVLKATKDLKVRHDKSMAVEKLRAEEAERNAEKVKSQLAFLQAERKVAEQEDERLLQEQLQANREKNKQWAKDTAKKLEEKKQQDADLEQRIKAAKADEKRIAKERKADLQQQERDKQRAEERAQTSFLAESKDIRECLDRFLSTECPVYDRLKAWIRNPRVTEELRGLLMLSLRDLSARAADFSPYPVKPTPPKD